VRDFFIYAAYIPSAQNVEAIEFRMISEETEWILEQTYFDKIRSILADSIVVWKDSGLRMRCHQAALASWSREELVGEGGGGELRACREVKI